MRFTSIVLAAASLLLVEANTMEKRGMYPCPIVSNLITEASPEQEVCSGQVIVSETFIGKDSNVKLAEVFCPENVATQSLNARQVVDVCNNTCRFLFLSS